jgi:hypothetical protein
LWWPVKENQPETLRRHRIREVRNPTEQASRFGSLRLHSGLIIPLGVPKHLRSVWPHPIQ